MKVKKVTGSAFRWSLEVFNSLGIMHNMIPAVHGIVDAGHIVRLRDAVLFLSSNHVIGYCWQPEFPCNLMFYSCKDGISWFESDQVDLESLMRAINKNVARGSRYAPRCEGVDTQLESTNVGSIRRWINIQGWKDQPWIKYWNKATGVLLTREYPVTISEKEEEEPPQEPQVEVESA